MSASAKFGSANPNTVKPVRTLSIHVPRRSAATIPRGMETINAITIAAAANCRLTGSLSLSKAVTG